MKCRGCGKDNAIQGEEVEGLGFMHDKCEIRRLRAANSELQSILSSTEAERDIADKQLSVICEGVNRRCGADANQLPLVSLDRMLAAHKRDLTECRRLLREARDECRNRIDYRCVVCRGADAVERFSAAEAEREQYRMLAVSYGKTLRVSEASVDSIVTARLAQKRAAKGGRDE